VILSSSRYAQVEQLQVTLPDGRSVTAVKLRRLPATTGEETVVKGNDQLDITAERRYGDATRYWHIADANTALEAATLTEQPGRTIRVPDTSP
jgi:nucleoid-associated protein YgaU